MKLVKHLVQFGLFVEGFSYPHRKHISAFPILKKSFNNKPPLFH